MSTGEHEPKTFVRLEDANETDRTFASEVHRQAYREVVTRQFGQWDDEFQSAHFDDTWQSGGFKVIYSGDQPCGYTKFTHDEHAITLHELVVLPLWQRHGIGSHILSQLQTEARQAALPITLKVLKESEAVNLYERFGFVTELENETHYQMSWIPNSEQSTSEASTPEIHTSSYREQMQQITASFEKLFAEAGYTQEPAVPITQKVDKTVRFVGAPISVMKPRLLTGDIPQPGVFMVQDCLRTQNLASLFNPDDLPTYGSFFTAMGALVRYDDLPNLFSITNNLLLDRLNIPSNDLFISTDSSDKDLATAAVQDGRVKVRHDTQPADLYRHGYGIEGVWGRNISYWLRNASTGVFEDVGNIIVIENDTKQLGAELALGSSTLVKQLAGLDNVMECYELTVTPNGTPEAIKRKLEDTVLTTLALHAEGLRPSSRDNQTRILRSYMKAMSMYSRMLGISHDTLTESLEASASAIPLVRNAREIAREITDWLAAYELQLADRGAQNREDHTILHRLGDTAIDTS